MKKLKELWKDEAIQYGVTMSVMVVLVFTFGLWVKIW